MGRAVVFTCVAALVVFAVVQDRVMVAGVAEYVSTYPSVTIDDVMKPAVSSSVQQGAMWGGAVLIVGLGGTFVARKRSRRA